MDRKDLASIDTTDLGLTDKPIPVIAETVNVYKNVVDNGGVRIRKIVHEDVVEVDEELATHSVKLTRIPINREVDGPVSMRYEGGVTIIPVVEERIVISRKLVLVEEIHVSRQTAIKRVPQSVTVRREEVVIERQKPGDDHWHLEDDREANPAAAD